MAGVAKVWVCWWLVYYMVVRLVEELKEGTEVFQQVGG
jgi:hypothetical protein